MKNWLLQHHLDTSHSEERRASSVQTTRRAEQEEEEEEEVVLPCYLTQVSRWLRDETFFYLGFDLGPKVVEERNKVSGGGEGVCVDDRLQTARDAQSY